MDTENSENNPHPPTNPNNTTAAPLPNTEQTTVQQGEIDSPSSESDSALQHDDCLLCPVCKDLLMIPRMYTCGHNVCEDCMINIDKTVEEDTIHALPIYKCPICRAETLAKWNDRPVNNTLIDVLCKISSDYKLKHTQYRKKNPMDFFPTTIPKNINLAYLCKNMRHFKCEQLYKQILPLLYQAAIEGKSYVTITSNTTDISLVADMLAKELIKKNGIYRFIAGSRECQIELVPTERTYRCEYENDDYDTEQPILEDDTDTEEPASPPIAGGSASNNISYTNEPHATTVAVTIHDSDGNPVTERPSVELSNFIVNHVLRNLARTRSQQNN